MDRLNDLKPILHSKRANLYYLEYCRVMQKDGRVLYLTEAKKQNQFFNIPIADTTKSCLCLVLERSYKTIYVPRLRARRDVR
jgi:CRISPR-associated protein Cas1